MEKRIFFLIGFLLLSFSIYAQDDFLPGKIYLENGSVLEGLVESKIWNRNPEKINFKTQSETTVYKFNELKRVEVGNFIFEKAAIKYEVSSSNPKQLTDSPILEFALDTVFLRVIIEGPKSLLMFKTKQGKPQFYIKHENQITLLEHRFYLARTEGLVLRENKRYINQLVDLLGDCPTITQNLNGLSYKEEPIERLFKKYFECINYSPSFTIKREKTKIAWGVNLGLTNTTFNGEGNFYGTDVFASKDYTQSLAPTVGGFFETVVKGTNEKLKLHADALFTYYKVEGAPNKFALIDENGVGSQLIGKREIEQLHLKLYPGIMYSLGNEKFKFNLKAGLGLGVALLTKSSVVFDNQFYEKDPLLDNSSLDVGFTLGGGFSFNKLILNAFIENKSSGMDPNGNAKLDRIVFTVGYKLSK